jgi:Fic family protein
VNAYITREAVSSSRIEGTQASVTEVFDAVVTGEAKRDDIREVRNYISALEHGARRMQRDDFPISLRLIREMHEILLTGVRGQDKTPGEFRRTQKLDSVGRQSPRHRSVRAASRRGDAGNAR